MTLNLVVQPLQILIGIALLIYTLGYSALVGLAVSSRNRQAIESKGRCGDRSWFALRLYKVSVQPHHIQLLRSTLFIPRSVHPRFC